MGARFTLLYKGRLQGVPIIHRHAVQRWRVEIDVRQMIVLMILEPIDAIEHLGTCPAMNFYRFRSACEIFNVVKKHPILRFPCRGG